MAEERASTGWAAWGCAGVFLLTYGGAYLVARVAHVLVNHGYQRVRSPHWGITAWDVVFAPLTALEEWARGFH